MVVEEDVEDLDADCLGLVFLAHVKVRVRVLDVICALIYLRIVLLGSDVSFKVFFIGQFLVRFV